MPSNWDPNNPSAFFYLRYVISGEMEWSLSRDSLK